MTWPPSSVRYAPHGFTSMERSRWTPPAVPVSDTPSNPVLHLGRFDCVFLPNRISPMDRASTLPPGSGSRAVTTNMRHAARPGLLRRVLPGRRARAGANFSPGNSAVKQKTNPRYGRFIGRLKHQFQTKLQNSRVQRGRDSSVCSRGQRAVGLVESHPFHSRSRMRTRRTHNQPLSSIYYHGIRRRRVRFPLALPIPHILTGAG